MQHWAGYSRTNGQDSHPSSAGECLIPFPRLPRWRCRNRGRTVCGHQCRCLLPYHPDYCGAKLCSAGHVETQVVQVPINTARHPKIRPRPSCEVCATHIEGCLSTVLFQASLPGSRSHDFRLESISVMPIIFRSLWSLCGGIGEVRRAAWSLLYHKRIVVTQKVRSFEATAYNACMDPTFTFPTNCA